MEQNKNNQFVVLPNEVVDCENISPKSLVIYCAIKRHMNKETLESFPEIKTIAKNLDVERMLLEKLLKN